METVENKENREVSKSDTAIGFSQIPVAAVNDSDALRCFGSNEIPTQRDIEETKASLNRQKDQVKGWCRQKILAHMIKSAQEQKIPSPDDNGTNLVTDITEIEAAWALDGSMKRAEQIWWVCFGSFDLWKNWDIELESQYMKECGWIYEGNRKSTPRAKGCVSKIVAWQKNQLVKLINKATLAEGSHRQSVSVSRPQEEIKKCKKSWKRPKGKFFPWMVREHEGMSCDECSDEDISAVENRETNMVDTTKSGFACNRDARSTKETLKKVCFALPLSLNLSLYHYDGPFNIVCAT